uniref:TBC1 domain family member 20 n=1 Tax=Phallusia mammillata TaxID=59560 RepID=A0A6F9DTS8_9ASCI|nr:TBC1 domain family member 20 [Phallusia mammillata]
MLLEPSKAKAKLKEVNKALNKNPVDVAALRKLCISPGGLICSEARQKVWPHLLDVAESKIGYPQDLRRHKECRQVILDVDRSGKRFPDGLSDVEKEELQENLTDLILGVLTIHPELHYYQGYHDICITFLLVCGAEASLAMVEKISTHHLRDFMDPTMDSTTHILNYLIPILKMANPKLVEYMEKSEVGTIFALSWLITWYSYVVPDQRDIERLYDFFLSCHPLMPVYFAAQIVLDNADKILDGPCEMARIYQLLLQIARKPNLPLEILIQRSSDFYIQFPPSSLAHDAAEFYKNNLAISTFCDHALVAKHEAPDVVLKRMGLVEVKKEENEESPTEGSWKRASKTVAIALSGAVGAALLAVGGRAAEWVPQLFGYL